MIKYCRTLNILSCSLPYLVYMSYEDGCPPPPPHRPFTGSGRDTIDVNAYVGSSLKSCNGKPCFTKQAFRIDPSCNGINSGGHHNRISHFITDGCNIEVGTVPYLSIKSLTVQSAPYDIISSSPAWMLRFAKTQLHGRLHSST